MNGKAKIVSDGRRRALDGSIGEIRREVETKYAEELRKAGPLRRMLLRCRIEWEIRREARRIAPPDGLYSRER